MANSAKVSMTASVFRDEVRNKFSGESIQNFKSRLLNSIKEAIEVI